MYIYTNIILLTRRIEHVGLDSKMLRPPSGWYRLC